MPRPFHTVSALAFALALSACAAGDGGIPVPGRCTADADCMDDGVFCNGPMVCQAGACVAGMAPSCEDGIACTEDSCSATSDACQNVPNNELCPAGTACQAGMGCVTAAACEFDSDCGGDGVFCNGDEVCVESSCTSPGMRSCDDENSCTIDECVESSASCANMPADHLRDVTACGPTGENDCVVCPTPTPAQVNMVASCDAGTCRLECAEGFGDSDRDLTNGCECAGGTTEADPDASFLDENCDGIDGDRSRGMLVSASAGNDNDTCGLELDRPCRTIAHAMTRGITESRRDLFLMAGVYEEIVTLRDGVRLFGGYDTSWERGPRSESEHRTELRGALSEAEGQYVAVIAHGLVVAPTLENLVIVGPDAEMAGLGSYAVHVEDSAGLEVIRCAIVAGHGAAGAAGVEGTDASVVTATASMAGGGGGTAARSTIDCDDSTSGAGGSAGTNACSGGPSTADPAAGRGGAGGTRETSCTCIAGVCACGSDAACNATGGENGVSASQRTTSGYGYRGAGAADRCAPGSAGLNGRVRNGTAGDGAGSFRGRVVEGYWIGEAGDGGGTGENGGGGGGGGGAAGCDDPGSGIGDNSYGSGGGGGGAGGCAALSGGGGGGGGGGSFGVFVVNSTGVIVSNCELQRGNGGAGGEGGAGGRGQSGGVAGLGGATTGTTSDSAGDGGAGGHGGHGGGGGGGAGGISVGVFTLGATVDLSSSSVTGGSAGVAGTGGVSAPGAPAEDRDGSDGTDGVEGDRSDAFACATAADC